MEASQNASPVRTSIDELVSNLARQREEKYRAALRRRVVLDYSARDFLGLLKAHAEVVMAERGDFTTFHIDDHNGPVLEQLYKYSVMDRTFQGSLLRGIVLIGKYGCGKTVIMEAYARLVNGFTEQQSYASLPLQVKTSTKVYNEAKGVITNQMIFTPLVIDELGREPKTAKDYGNESAPLMDLLFERHRRGITTHATGNFKLETLAKEDMYGPMLGDRLKQMFNFITLPGESRR